MSRLTRLLIGVGVVALTAAEPLTPEQIAKVRELVRPTADEDKWDRIPWQISLTEAREQAARQGKPILLWEMDGHPLGCT
jgi:hypothetical protein